MLMARMIVPGAAALGELPGELPYLGLLHESFLVMYLLESVFRLSAHQGRSNGGISVYIPPKSVYLNFFMCLFCLLDPFIPTQIKFLATPLVHM